MIAKLERLIGEIGDLNSTLILLVGSSRSGKTQLLRQLGAKLNIEPLNVGLELGRFRARPIGSCGGCSCWTAKPSRMIAASAVTGCARGSGKVPGA